MSDVDQSLDTVLVPDCQECHEPARYQYEIQKTCSAGPYSVSRETCAEHALSTGSKSKWEGTSLSKVFGRVDGKLAPIEVDPHYFCKKNGGEWCMDGHEDTCPVHGDTSQ